MRFDRLDLVRYGALTDKRLIFRPDAGLHIVYGPNEAGKSSALSAISDLLFGFPDRSDYGFLHDSTALRVGAALTARDGLTLACRRRKGRKNTLLADTESEEALPDDALAPFTGTLSRDVFTRAFGLDSASLRAGGETMLKSGGEIGSLLFSAASGLTGLSSLRKSLDGEADAIYSQRRSKDRRFYQVLDTHEAARRAEREHELRAADWKKLLAEEAEIAADLDVVQAERAETRRALDRLHRLIRLEPIVRDIDRDIERAARLDLPAGLPSGAEDDLAELLDDLRRNEDAKRAAEQEVVRLRQEIETVHVDAALIGAAPRILALHARSGVYLNARQDIPRVRFEVDDFAQRLTLAARRLGFSGPEELERAQPADADLVRLREAVEKGQEFDLGLKQLARRTEEERDALGKLDVDIGGGRVVDPKPLMDKLIALRPDIADLSGLEALKIRQARAERDLAGAVARLDPPVRDVEQLLGAPLPDLETLAAQKRAIDAARGESAQLAHRLASLKEEAENLGVELASLAMGGEIVSREAIAAAREKRNALLDAVSTGGSDAEGLRQVRDATDEADRLADAALSDAERVLRHAQLNLRLRELKQRILVAEGKAKEGAIAVSDAITEFEDLFHSVPVVPSAPERMIEWRRAIDGISLLASALDDAKDAAEALLLKEEALKPALLALSDAAGVSAGALPVGALARELERKMDELSASWNERRSLERLRLEAARKLTSLEEEEAALRRQVDQWRHGFMNAATLAGLSEDASMEMALAALDIWRSVPGTLAERENRERRVRGMVRDMQEFEDAVRAICAETAPSLSALPAEVSAALLSDRLAEARSADDRRSVLVTALQRADAARSRADDQGVAISARLAQFAENASVGADALGGLLEDLRARNLAEIALDQSRRRFLEQADGLTEADARLELSGFDRIAAIVEIERLETEDGRQVERLKTLGIAQADNDRRRQALESGIGAERAVFEKLSAEEEARDLARRWVVLKLAAALLSQSMEAYREKQADPVLTRAGQLFSNLTGGRFSRLVQLYDEQDELQLAAERVGGRQVPLAGLSEGTGDQLYLALRLAFLEDYCSRNEPVPLVLDDIFQTFDDERTAAGLRTLSEAGETFQTILFTHQLSLVAAAERELGDRVDLVRLDSV